MTETIHRGDWILWLNRKSKNYNLQTLTLAKAHCANTVRHLMKDKRSTDAVDVAIRFGEGNATRDELNAAADAAAADRSEARKKNQQLTADICRKYLLIPKL